MHSTYFLLIFFVVEGIRLCAWRAKQLNIGGSNLTNVQYANIGSQVRFVDTVKYYQQPLSSLAKSADENEKGNIRASCKKFIQNHSTYSASFFALSDDDKEWILGYLCGGKGVISYEKIKSSEDLDSVPESEFYRMTEFYSSLKNKIIKPDEYKNVKKNLAENENEKATSTIFRTQ